LLLGGERTAAFDGEVPPSEQILAHQGGHDSRSEAPFREKRRVNSHRPNLVAMGRRSVDEDFRAVRPRWLAAVDADYIDAPSGECRRKKLQTPNPTLELGLRCRLRFGFDDSPSDLTVVPT
jgi:hypothetical protein